MSSLADTHVKLKLSKMEIAYLEEDRGSDDDDIDVENQKKIINTVEELNKNVYDSKEMIDVNDVHVNDVHVNDVDVDIDDVSCNNMILDSDGNEINPPSRCSYDSEREKKKSDKLSPFDIDTKLGQQVRMLEDEIEMRRNIRRRNNCISHCIRGCKTFFCCMFLLYIFFIGNLYIVLRYERPIRYVLDIPYIDSDNVINNSGSKGVDRVKGVDGVDGVNGVNGVDGVDGVNGVDGVDGINGTIIFFNATEYLENMIENVTIRVLDKINKNGVINVDEINSNNIVSTNIVGTNIVGVNGNLTNIKSEIIDAIDYTGTKFNRCVSGWC